ncbi:MAG: phosphoribosylglycinamide formyltransferase [Paenibacillaceae bacterium]|nr:phosphoribosylglycinamide formyltransferase [Paenibacillaceae bacterium]
MTARIAVFASGSGSNFEALVRSARAYEVVVLVCDRPGAGVLTRAQQLNVPSIVYDVSAFSSRMEYERAVCAQLQALRIEYICLAGYMRLITEQLRHAYPDRIANVHPSLLPAFPGKCAIEDAFAYGVKYTGVTIHLVDEGIDTGPILAQETVPIFKQDTIETIAKRIHAIEHALYAQTVTAWVRGQFVRHGRTMHQDEEEQ